MAEATLAVSFPRPGTPPRTVSVDKNTLVPDAMVEPVPDGSAHAKRVVSAGCPVHRLSARIAAGGNACVAHLIAFVHAIAPR
jgi:fatty-acyl-CoA synthase